MKTYSIIFGIMAIVAIIGSLKGATHQIAVAAFAGALSFLFYIEYKKLKHQNHEKRR